MKEPVNVKPAAASERQTTVMEGHPSEGKKHLHQRYGLAITLVLASLISILFLLQPVIESSLQITRNYNEGWNAYHAEHAIGNEILYPKPTALFTNNYPPLSFYITGGLGSLVGDHIFAGRLLGFISLISLSISIGVIVRILGGGISAPVFSSILFIGYMAAYHDNYVGVNDPQMLAHAIMMIGLILFLVGRHLRLFLLLSLLLIFAAGLTKHSLIALPVAMTIWLYLHDRKQLLSWITLTILLLISFLTVLYQAYGMDFFMDVLASPREYNRYRAVTDFFNWIKPLYLLIGAGLLFVLADRATPATRLIGLYALFAAIFGIYFSGAEGVNYNAAFDLVIAAVIASGLAIQYFANNLQEKWPRSSIETIAVIILFLPVLVWTPSKLLKLKYYINRMENSQTIVAKDIALIKEHKGPVICENLALCYWAGKKPEADFFNLGQKVIAGIIPESNITTRLDSHYFTLIQVESYVNKGTSWRLPENINDSILANYEILRSSQVSGFFMVPKGS